MYRMFMIAVIALALTVPAIAQDTKPAPAPKNVTITFTGPELDALVGLLDVAVKSAGLKAVPVAANVLAKLQAALKPPAEKK